MNTVSIELRGGPLGGRVWAGPEVPTRDGYPVHFAIGDKLTILATGVGVIAMLDLELVLGWYSPTGETCGEGHKIYVWEMTDVRWN